MPTASLASSTDAPMTPLVRLVTRKWISRSRPSEVCTRRAVTAVVDLSAHTRAEECGDGSLEGGV